MFVKVRERYIVKLVRAWRVVNLDSDTVVDALSLIRSPEHDLVQVK